MPKPSFDEIISGKPSFESIVKKKKKPKKYKRFVEGYEPYGVQDTLLMDIPTPRLYKSLEKELPQNIGGEIGEGIGLGVAGVPGSMIGSALGGAIGKNIQQDIAEKRGAEKLDFSGRMKLTGKAALEEGLATGAGHIVAKVGKKVLAPFKGKLIKEAAEMIPLSEKYGSHLTPGQLTDSWMADTLETVADSSFFGGRRMKKLKIRMQPEAIGKFADDIAESFTKRAATTLDPDSIGKLVDDALGERNKIFMNQAKALYGKVDELTEGILTTIPMTERQVSKILDPTGVPVSTEITKMVEKRIGQASVNVSSLKKFAMAATKESTELKGIGASEAGETLLGKIKQLNDTISFGAAQKLRSRLLDEEMAMAITKDKQRGIVKKLIGLTNQSIDMGGKNLSPQALKAFRTANRFYKSGKERYANKVIRNLIQTVENRGEPEKIIPYIFQNKAVSRIKKTKTALGVNSTAWNSLKAKYVESLLVPKPNKLIGSNVTGDLHKMGDTALKEIFHPEELKAIRKLGTWSNLVGGRASKEMATGGSMVVQLVQGGAILGVLSGRFQEIATPVFILPEVISQLASRPNTAKWLSAGFDMPSSAPQAVALSIRIMKAVNRARQDVERQKNLRSAQFRLPTRPISGHHF